MYEDAAVGVADRVRREEAAREATRLERIRRRMPTRAPKLRPGVDAGVQAKGSRMEAGAQTDVVRDPRLYNPEIDKQIAEMEAFLDQRQKAQRVGPAVSWGTSSSTEPAV